MTITTATSTEVHTLPETDMATRAITALIAGADTFTRAQVAYLMHLAFRAGIEATEVHDDPHPAGIAYRAGYADGIEDGYDGAHAELWEGIRFAFAGPRRQPDRRNGIRGNLTAADAVWWHTKAVEQRDARREADRQPAQPCRLRLDDPDWPPVTVPGQQTRHLGENA